MIAAKTDTYEIQACRGVLRHCHHAALSTPDYNFLQELPVEVEAAIQETGWPEFLYSKIPGAPRNHHRFRVHLSACPNGCSQPHIADFACIAAVRPIMPEACSTCGTCVETCPDKALSLPDDVTTPIMEPSACLSCGICLRSCPEQAITPGESGLRLLAGGRLGRHPHLARELAGVFQIHEALDMLKTALRFYMREYHQGTRFGDHIREYGPEVILR